MRNEQDYSFLKGFLSNFISEKGKGISEGRKNSSSSKIDFDKNLQSLVDNHFLTESEVNTYIRGIEHLSPEKLLLIAAMQSELSGLVHSTPVQIVAEPLPKMPVARALDWTIVHLELLNLSGLHPRQIYTEYICKEFIDVQCNPVNIARGFSFPFLDLHLQCHWCGKVDMDFEKRQVSKHRRMFCHAEDCLDTSNSNPSEHADCCLGEWGHIRRRFKEKLRYWVTHTHSEAEYQAQVIECFKTFCEERFMDNLNQERDVVTEWTYGLMQAAHTIKQIQSSPGMIAFQKKLEAARPQLESFQGRMEAFAAGFKPFYQRLDHFSQSVSNELKANPQLLQRLQAYVEQAELAD